MAGFGNVSLIFLRLLGIDRRHFIRLQVVLFSLFHSGNDLSLRFVYSSTRRLRGEECALNWYRVSAHYAFKSKWADVARRRHVNVSRAKSRQ